MIRFLIKGVLLNTAIICTAYWVTTDGVQLFTPALGGLAITLFVGFTGDDL